MAVDSAILKAIGRETVLPTLRLYRWNPPCLSLGYSQPYSDLDQEKLNQNGWDIVRRPTGGRAILHAVELTYSVIGSQADPRLKGGLLESYRRISQALAESLSILGLAVQINLGKKSDNRIQAVCFENPSEYEITIAGKKIIGSAQARKKEGILQHGSLPLTGDLGRITEVLQYPSDVQRHGAARELLNKAVTVESALGRFVSWEEAAQAFQTGFQKALNLQLIPGELSAPEKEDVEHLVKIQYGNSEWTRQI
jgi:lipoate-protein ligase A